MKTVSKQYLHISILSILFFSLFFIILSNKTESQDAEKTYNIDAVHSAVFFRAKHLGVTYNYGRFNEFSGNITLDESDISKSKVELVVKTASVDSANAKRDQHLRSPDFFNVKQFPVITFNSTKVSKKEGHDKTLEVTGDFELHGVKKSITVDVEITGKANNPQVGEIIGFLATFDIKRSEYGFNFGLENINDEIQITVSIEARVK
ncbi:MAG: YceI family protein [Candidatus Poribacteria bacterium]|nr:YceI family protein [Candidatus Poribacteria bacterium]